MSDEKPRATPSTPTDQGIGNRSPEVYPVYNNEDEDPHAPSTLSWSEQVEAQEEEEEEAKAEAVVTRVPSGARPKTRSPPSSSSSYSSFYCPKSPSSQPPSSLSLYAPPASPPGARVIMGARAVSTAGQQQQQRQSTRRSPDTTTREDEERKREGGGGARPPRAPTPGATASRRRMGGQGPPPPPQTTTKANPEADFQPFIPALETDPTWSRSALYLFREYFQNQREYLDVLESFVARYFTGCDSLGEGDWIRDELGQLNPDAAARLRGRAPPPQHQQQHPTAHPYDEGDGGPTSCAAGSAGSYRGAAGRAGGGGCGSPATLLTGEQLSAVATARQRRNAMLAAMGFACGGPFPTPFQQPPYYYHHHHQYPSYHPPMYQQQQQKKRWQRDAQYWAQRYMHYYDDDAEAVDEGVVTRERGMAPTIRYAPPIPPLMDIHNTTLEVLPDDEGVDLAARRGGGGAGASRGRGGGGGGQRQGRRRHRAGNNNNNKTNGAAAVSQELAG